MLRHKTPLSLIKGLPSFGEAGIPPSYVDRVLPRLGISTVEDFLGLIQTMPRSVAESAETSLESLTALFEEAAAKLVSPQNQDLLVTVPDALGAFGVPREDAARDFTIFGADMAEVAATAPEPISTPASVSLIDGCLPPARDQGNRFTCTAFVTAGILEYLLCRFQGTRVDLSEQYLFWLVSQERGLIQERARLEDVFELAQGLGVCREDLWTYEGDRRIGDPTHGNPPNRLACEQDAANHRFSQVRPLADPQDLDAIRQLLAGDLPVAIEIPIFDSYASGPLFYGGQLTLPPGDEPAIVDEHAVVLVGYRSDASNPENDRFLVRNSKIEWGRDSGLGAGHGTIVPEYITRYATGAWFGSV